MKTYIDRIRDMSIENIKLMINQQEAQIEIMKLDLQTMNTVLLEKQLKKSWMGNESRQ